MNADASGSGLKVQPMTLQQVREDLKGASGKRY